MIGAYTLEYQRIDVAGNASTKLIRTVTVADMTAPVVTVLGPSSVTHERDLTYTDSGATWVDNVDGSGSLTASGLSSLTVTGTYTLLYTKTDVAGNVGTGSRSVTVVDTIAPVVTITTPAVTVDASVYQISGTAPGASLVEISTGGSVLASMTPVSGYFSLFVPLPANTASTFIVSASDADGNVGTGQVIITSSSAA